ncbi:DUF4870 domain-containing protein [Aureibaculum sp. A20]|uniref:DUF4870 domain-containing protein n=1 Tax=Aureibaculum flavum TaxID=2795986 RepID=A0ABS0WLL1_9FLAO|nr:DUF4870 domain-containing protein [Aureibaculum flavum]MBJ2172852.1 DUF4870 domain-containing protein [Aureibaculum flavum]
MDQNTIDEGKTMGIIAYIFGLGTLIAWFMNKDKNNAFAAYHIRQGVKLFILTFVIYIVVNILIRTTHIWSLSYLQYIPLIFIVLGVMNANNGKTEPLPVIGTIGDK